jgi:hypothetical protein
MEIKPITALYDRYGNFALFRFYQSGCIAFDASEVSKILDLQNIRQHLLRLSKQERTVATILGTPLNLISPKGLEKILGVCKNEVISIHNQY